MKSKMFQRVKVLLVLTVILTISVFVLENVFDGFVPVVIRNGYGLGSRTEEYEVEIEGVEGKHPICVEVQEREYVGEEVQEMFRKVMERLDKVILGKNQSLDRVEKDLQLVNALEGYPVEMAWELDSYDVLNVDGTIRREDLPEEGILVELRATISYREEKAVYIRNARIFPVTRKGVDQLLYEIQTELQKQEETTRANEQFELPERVGGRKITWNQEKEKHWYYVLILGGTLSVYLIYREKEKVRRMEKRRQEQLKRDYPELISKLTMLLGTGITLRSAWERIVENYEIQKAQLGKRVVYEEMQAAIHEMKSGISEAEAYERFGKRCGDVSYVKFATLISQNLRKGSKGLSALLKMEAIQAFENRKSLAKRKGEEAGAKLMMPMIGMLAVVFVMIMVPAFYTLQI